MTDKRFIDGLLRHDSKIIEEIYKNYAHRIQIHIQKNGGTAEDAKDVFHNALMVIFQKAKTGKFELTSRFYTYLFSVCHFIWDREKKKKSNNTVTIETPDRLTDTEDIERRIFEREKHNIFKEQFSRLDKFCQQILELFFQQKSMTEIAKLLELKNEHTARTRKYRCQKGLEKMIRGDVRYKEVINS